MKIPEDRTWIDIKKQHHLMSRMTVQHLKACLSMCEKSGWRLNEVPYLKSWIFYKEYILNTPLGKALSEQN